MDRELPWHTLITSPPVITSTSGDLIQFYQSPATRFLTQQYSVSGKISLQSHDAVKSASSDLTLESVIPTAHNYNVITRKQFLVTKVSSSIITVE